MNSVLDRLSEEDIVRVETEAIAAAAIVPERPEDRDGRGMPLPPPMLWFHISDGDHVEGYRRVRRGTRDRVWLDVLFPWRLGEVQLLQEELVRRTGQSFLRVRMVVSVRYEHSFHVRLIGRDDWKICRAAVEILDDPVAFSEWRESVRATCEANWSKSLGLDVSCPGASL